MRTSPNWLVGNRVEQNQHESGNAFIAFPFEDNLVPDGYPCDWIVDACIVVPSTTEATDAGVDVTCLHMSGSMVSVMISVGGIPALHCNVLKDSFEPFAPVKLESILGECSGMITFGGLKFDRTATYRDPVPISESAVVRPVVGRLKRFVQPGTGREAIGDVRFLLPDGVGMSVSDDGDSSVIKFTTDDRIRESVVTPCMSADVPNGMPVPITSINGVKPDANGRIAIVFAKSPEDVPE